MSLRVNTNGGVLHNFLVVGVFLKAVHAVVDVGGAIALYFVTGTTLYNIVASVTARELIEDPNDVVAQFLLNQAGHITSSGQDFAILYLLISSAINGLLVAAVFVQRVFLYRIALATLALLTAYECYLYFHTHSPWLALIITYDVCLIALITREYYRARAGTTTREFE